MSKYATIADLNRVGLTSEKSSKRTDDDLNRALELASGVADSYLAQVFTLPLTAWGADLSSAVAKIAAYDLMSTQIGYNPASASGETWRARYEDAMRWLEMVAASKITAVGVVDTPLAEGESESSGMTLKSTALRGWSHCR